MKIAKTNSDTTSIKYADARDEALCYGWIDGQMKSIDENFYLRKFTPRRPNSVWSKVNREIVEKLIKEKRILPSGLKEVEKAKSDGRWKKAYDSSKTAKPPKEFLDLISKSKKAQDFWDSLTKSKQYPMIWKLQVLKTEKKKIEWMNRFYEMLKKREIWEIFPSKEK